MPTISESLYERGCKVIPGGVNSPVRAFGSVGGDPVFVESGSGSRIRTCDGEELIDYCGSWGPLILGHAHPEVVEAVRKAACEGLSFGISTEREVEFAELICECVPSIEKVRLVSSGTEATMTALRLVRGVTGRSKIIKFAGNYHGHSDSLLVKAGSGLLTSGTSSSAGVPDSVARETVVCPYNDIAAFESIMDSIGNEIAGIIVEPVAGNMGLVPGENEFLRCLRTKSQSAGALLIFDEVISGFRLAPTTFGETCGITPDLTCLGKIIGGGMPIGAVGGSADIMDHLAPLGKVYQAGTLSGNPVSVAAGTATLRILNRDNPYEKLESLGSSFADGLERIARNAGVALLVSRKGGMLTPFFQSRPVRNESEATLSDTETFARFFRGMRKRGVYLSPSQFEVDFISTAHTEDDIEITLKAAEDTLTELKISDK